VFKAIKAVFWSFFGVRRGQDHDWDAANLKISHVIVAGLLAVAMFIFVLVMLVKFVTR
jgi:hypothetical protein